MRFSSAPIRALAIVCLVGPSFAHAQAVCSGLPFVNVVRPRAIEESAAATVGPQIFDTAVHPRGFVLLANNNGLLTYDGVSFRLMPLGRAGVALSIAAGKDGRMFAGGARTFGEVIEDPIGVLLYQPLESRLPPEDRNFSDVWQTLVSSDGVAYFRSPERLVVLRNGETQAFKPAGRFSAIALVDDVLYAHDNGVGLVRVEASGLSAVAGGESLKGVRVTALVAGEGGALIIGTQEAGLLSFDPATGRTERLGASVASLGAAEILSLRRLDDGSIAVGTLRSGLFMLDGKGRLLFRMDVDRGLPDNAVLTLQTSPGSLWVGTSGGFAQLLVPASVQTFSSREGLPGIVESIVRHEGSIYAATSQGVFRQSCADRPFEPVSSLRTQSFALISAGSLLAASADGIHEIGATTSRLLRPGLARSFAKSKDADRLWVATQTGAAALSRVGGAWSSQSLKMGVADANAGDLLGVEATSVGEDVDGRLWIALVTGRVISGLPVKNGETLELEAVRVFGEAEGLTGGFAEVISLKDGVRIGTATAVLRPRGERLVPDEVFVKALGSERGAFRIEDVEDSGYWVASAKRPIRLTRLDGALVVRDTSLLRTPAGSRILDFLEVSSDEVWIGTDDGAFRYDPTADGRMTNPISALVRRAESRGLELFFGGPTDSFELPLPHLSPLRFEVASSSLDDPSRNRFRFRLDGQDTDWSPWTTEARKDYTNLGPGTYRFRVETRDVYGRVGKEAGYSFVVLTPWYLKPWAIGLGLAALAGLFFLALQLRTRSLRKRQRELETIVDQKTLELREASFTDPLTGLRNRRYFTEVMDSEVSLACRPGSPALHLFLVDLDHFKSVNDTHGHAAGDEVLRHTAARLRTAMRTSDLIFRWGGEEFLIVARGAADLPRSEIANRIVRMIGKEPFDIGTGTPLPRTCSVGFATFPFYPDSPTTVPLDAVIELTDLALYRAKETGRNRAIGVSPQSGVPSPGEVWKNQILENLERVAVSVEVLEGPGSAS